MFISDRPSGIEDGTRVGCMSLLIGVVALHSTPLLLLLVALSVLSLLMGGRESPPLRYLSVLARAFLNLGTSALGSDKKCAPFALTVGLQK